MLWLLPHWQGSVHVTITHCCDIHSNRTFIHRKYLYSVISCNISIIIINLQKIISDLVSSTVIKTDYSDCSTIENKRGKTIFL